MDLGYLTEALRELMVELYGPVTIPIPKLKKKVAGQHGYDPDRSAIGTKAGRPSSLAAKPDGDGTAAGVKPKSLDTKEPTGSGRSKTHNKRDNQKTAATPAKGKGGGEKPSCPGGTQPRMVFGKWRCAGGSKGAVKAKSRIATKRQTKKKGSKKAPAPKGTLAKLVHKARSALVSLFK